MGVVTFCEFKLSDVEDPEIYAAQPIWDWQQTDAGKWVMENATDVSYKIFPDMQSYGYRVSVYGKLDDHNTTFFKLKWG